jgi:hypothetical protein
MKRILVLVSFLALSLVATGVSLAQENPLIGTWKLNEAKSKLSPGTPKITTATYEAVGDNVKVTQDYIDSEGKPVHGEWTGKFDGEDYPSIDRPWSGARSFSLKKIDDHTLEFTNKRGVRVTNSGRIVISADGKTRTVTRSGTDSKGNKFSNTEVYDKQ